MLCISPQGSKSLKYLLKVPCGKQNGKTIDNIYQIYFNAIEKRTKRCVDLSGHSIYDLKILETGSRMQILRAKLLLSNDRLLGL